MCKFNNYKILQLMNIINIISTVIIDYYFLLKRLSSALWNDME